MGLGYKRNRKENGTFHDAATIIPSHNMDSHEPCDDNEAPWKSMIQFHLILALHWEMNQNPISDIKLSVSFLLHDTKEVLVFPLILHLIIVQQTKSFLPTHCINKSTMTNC